MTIVFRLLIILSFFMLTGFSVSEQESSDIQPYTLGNGLKTFVINNKNDYSENEVDLRLLIRAGSLQENDNERGYAHFVEHMAFNGTKDYPKNTLIAALEELGIRFASHANASTYFNYTEYRLKLDTADPVRLGKAIDILAQWAQYINFKEEEVSKEIPIIMEEWRLREPTLKSASHKLREALFKGSRYADRLPIGTTDSIKAANSELLKGFYTRWYRPDNAVLIASGDIDKAATQALIEKAFSGWRNNGPAPVYEISDLALKSIPQQLSFSDPSMVSSSLQLAFLGIDQRPQTLDEYAGTSPWKLGLYILEQRLSSRVWQSEGKISGAGTSWNRYSPNTRYIDLSVSLAKDDYAQGMRLLTGELAHIIQKGVTVQELDDARSATLNSWEKHQDSASYLAAQAVDHYIYGEPLNTKDVWFDKVEKKLAALTTADINAALTQIFSGQPRLIATYSERLPAPDMAALKTILDKPPAVEAKKVVADTADMWAIKPEFKGRIISESSEDTGATKWTLDNGITVYYQHNISTPGQTYFYLSAEGGLNMLKEPEIFAGRMTLPVMGSSGLREMNGPELDKWLSSRGMSISPDLDFQQRGMSGSAPTKQFGELMQLLHISLTESRVTDEVFSHLINKNKTTIEQFHKHPAWDGQLQIEAKTMLNDPALRTLSIEELSALKPEQLEAVYKKLLAGAQPYQLAIVGDISKEEAKALVLANIATLSKNAYTAPTRAAPVPKENVSIEYTGNGRRNSSVSMQWIIPRHSPSVYQYDHLTMLTTWLQELLSEEIREKQSLVYSIGTSGEGVYKDTPVWTLNISLECDTDKRRQVIDAVKAALTQFSTQDVSAEKLETMIKTARDERRQRYSKAFARASWLARNDQVNQPDEPHVLNIDQRFQGIEPDELKQLFAEFLRDDAVYVEVVGMP